MITAGACAAIAAIGRVGTTRAVHVHHVSLLQQLPGTQASVLTVRGIAEFPAFDRFALRLPSADGTLETTSARGTASGELDADGFPVVTGVFGVAGRQSFAGEAVVDARPLAVEDRGAMHRDREPVGPDAARLPARTRAGRGHRPARWRQARTSRRRGRASSDEAPGGPVITCVSDEAPLPFTETQRPVIMHGETTIAAYLGDARARGAGD